MVGITRSKVIFCFGHFRQATRRLLPKMDEAPPSETQATRQAFVERKRAANNLAAAFSESKHDGSQGRGPEQTPQKGDKKTGGKHIDSFGENIDI